MLSAYTAPPLILADRARAPSPTIRCAFLCKVATKCWASKNQTHRLCATRISSF